MCKKVTFCKKDSTEWLIICYNGCWNGKTNEEVEEEEEEDSFKTL